MTRPRPGTGGPLRILHLDHARALGGAERSILDLAVSQRSLGHDAIVGVGREGDFSAALSAVGVPWISMGWPDRAVETGTYAAPAALVAGAASMLGAARAVRRAVRRHAPDIVVAHTRKVQIAASLGLILDGTPLVWHLHDAVPPRAVVRIPARIASIRANRAVALSRWHGGQYAAARIPLRAGPVVAGDCVDLAPLEALPAAWPVRSGRPVVGFIGAVGRMKAPHLVLEAAERLPAGIATFRLFGSLQFPESEAEYAARFERLLATSAARDRVTLRGQAPSASAAFAEIDILVHCSTLPEPFGRVIVEAMASGRAIVAFRRGAPAEILDDSCAEFAATPDADGIAGALQRLIGDPDRTRAMVEQGRRRVGAYAPVVLAKRLDGIYRDLL